MNPRTPLQFKSGMKPSEPDLFIFAPEARWIWGHPVDGDYFPANTFWKFRRNIEWPDSPSAVHIHLTASTRYQLHCNGNFVGEGPPPCDPARQIVDTHELTSFLKPGVNRIAVLVHHAGVPTFNYSAAPGGLLAQCDWTGGRVVTDAGWWVARADEYNPHSHKRALQLVQSEIVDLRRREKGWMILDPDLTGRQSNNYGAFWRPAHEAWVPGLEPWSSFVLRTIPFRHIEAPHDAARLIRIAQVGSNPDPWDLTHLAKQVAREVVDAEEISPVPAFGLECPLHLSLERGLDRLLLFDLGGYFCGQPFIEVEAEAGMTVDVSLGEALFCGWVNPRYPKMLSANFTDRVVFEQGANEWRAFHWGAGRYLQLTLRGPGTITLRRAGIVPSYYPLELVGSYRSGDEQLDWLWETAAHTIRCCFHDQVVDCPTREQAQWVEHVSAPANWCAFGDPHLVRKMLIQVSESELPGEPGCLRTPWPAAVPCQTRSAWTNLPDQQLVWVDLIRQHDEEFNDLPLVRRLLPVVERVFAYHQRALNDAGLLDTRCFPEGSWFWIDWEQRYKEKEIASLNFFEAMILRSGAMLAWRAERPDLAEQWTRDAEQLAATAHAVFFDQGTGLYCEDRERKRPSQIATVFAILAGACRDDEVDGLLDRALAPPEGTDIGGSHFYIYLLPLLSRHGRTQTALDLIRASYREMFDARVPVLWENFSLGHEIAPESAPSGNSNEAGLLEGAERDVHFKRMRSGESRCHAYSAAPLVFLSRWVVGVRPLMAGCDEIVIEPRMDLLDACEAVVASPRGPISVQWSPDPSVVGGKLFAWSAPEGMTVHIKPWQRNAPSKGNLNVSLGNRLAE